MRYTVSDQFFTYLETDSLPEATKCVEELRDVCDGKDIGFRIYDNETKKKVIIPYTVFIVGKQYYPNDRSYDPITILRRTAKCVYVRGGSGNTWRMTVRLDNNGVEYVTDSCVPLHWRYTFTYSADNMLKEG